MYAFNSRHRNHNNHLLHHCLKYLLTMNMLQPVVVQVLVHLHLLQHHLHYKQLKVNNHIVMNKSYKTNHFHQQQLVVMMSYLMALLANQSEQFLTVVVW